jgi:hypothetical protein
VRNQAQKNQKRAMIQVNKPNSTSLLAAEDAISRKAGVVLRQSQSNAGRAQLHIPAVDVSAGVVWWAAAGLAAAPPQVFLKAFWTDHL